MEGENFNKDWVPRKWCLQVLARTYSDGLRLQLGIDDQNRGCLSANAENYLARSASVSDSISSSDPGFSRLHGPQQPAATLSNP